MKKKNCSFHKETFKYNRDLSYIFVFALLFFPIQVSLNCLNFSQLCSTPSSTYTNGLKKYVHKWFKKSMYTNGFKKYVLLFMPALHDFLACVRPPCAFKNQQLRSICRRATSAVHSGRKGG